MKAIYYRIKNYLATDNGKLVIKRIKSLLWRLFYMIATVVVAWLGKEVYSFNVPANVQVLLGLIIAEISKYIRDNQASIN